MRDVQGKWQVSVRPPRRSAAAQMSVHACLLRMRAIGAAAGRVALGATAQAPVACGLDTMTVASAISGPVAGMLAGSWWLVSLLAMLHMHMLEHTASSKFTSKVTHDLCSCPVSQPRTCSRRRYA